MKQNFLENLPKAINEEIIEILQSSKNFRIERIISFGQNSPVNFWYNQKENEWVILLKGKAGLRFEDKEEVVVLNENDYVFIPAFMKHRVEFTAENQETIWLAIFWN